MEVRRRAAEGGDAITHLTSARAAGGALQLVRQLAGRFSEHGQFVYASAIAFRALVSLVPLTLLALGLLGAFGLQDVWRDTVAPAIEPRFTPQVFRAIDSSAEKIFANSTAGLIAFASILLFWNLFATVFVVMPALSRIHDVQERRRLGRRIGVAAGLGLAIGLCVIGAVLDVVLVGRIHAGPVANGALAVAKWGAAIAILGLAVGLLVRFAPAERPEVSWASVGSIVVVAGWMLASLVFRWWVTSVANFTSAVGQLTFFLLLTAYVYISSAIFLVGTELDELLRKKTKT
jgi:membrane protein